VTRQRPADLEHRVLVLAPSGRDGSLTASVLAEAGIANECCSDLDSLSGELDAGVGAVILAEEAVVPGTRDRLADWVAGQPPWSDLPIVVLARPGADSAAVAQAMDLFGNVAVLERPTRLAALVSAVRSALRARQRQYQIRDHLADRDRSARAHALLAAIVASSDDAIVSKTLEGRILSWNAGAERIFGYSAAEAVGQPITLIIPPERAGEEPGLLERLRRGERVDHFETIRLTKDGRRIHISLTVSPVRNADGEIIAASKVARDVTERKLAAEALRAAQEELQVVTDNMAAAVIRCSRDLRYLWVSPVAGAWYGRRPEDVIGRHLQDVLGAEALALIQPHIDRVLGGERVEFEAELPYPTLGRRWVHAVYAPTRTSGGEVDGWVAVLTDTTPHHRFEDALREADRRKDEFLAVLAHELRNPLAPIRNSLHILRLTARADVVAQQAAEMLDRQVTHMVRLVDDLMEVSRITRGKIELIKDHVDVADVIRSAVETSRPLIESAGHELALSLPPEPMLLEGDPVRLAQVFANLLNNAAKYTEPGGHIAVTAHRDGADAVIAVRDTGTGIPQAMLPRVFEPFAQIDRHAARAQGGLGIGLTIVKSLVDLHGGRVEAHSDGPGRGSEFVVRLPLPAAPRTDGPQAARLAPSEFSTRRILVVDDNRDAAESLGMLMKLLGADVEVAFSGPDALAALAASKPEVVLLDIGMPGMDGHEVARRIRQQPELDDVVLIALTGWGQDEDRLRSQAAGFDHHLIKPVDLAALQALLGTLKARPVAQRARC
jgi:PAS domain S-box-containing protein